MRINDGLCAPVAKSCVLLPLDTHYQAIEVKGEEQPKFEIREMLLNEDLTFNAEAAAKAIYYFDGEEP